MKFYSMQDRVNMDYSTDKKQYVIKKINKDMTLTEPIYIIKKQEINEIDNIQEYKQNIFNNYIVLIDKNI